jgi:hypothetical protein
MVGTTCGCGPFCPSFGPGLSYPAIPRNPALCLRSNQDRRFMAADFMLEYSKRWDSGMPKISKAPKITLPNTVKSSVSRRPTETDKAIERHRRIAAALSKLGTFDPSSPSKKQLSTLELLEHEFDWLPQGTTVAVNLHNCEFIAGLNEADVIKRFSDAYGATQGWIFDVGRPSIVGGLCRR